MSTTERNYTTLPEGTLDVLIRQYGRGVYPFEALAMAQELKDLRARFNRKEDLNLAGAGDMDPVQATAWANSLRSRMMAQVVGDTIKIDGPYDMRILGMKQWHITRVW